MLTQHTDINHSNHDIDKLIDTFFIPYIVNHFNTDDHQYKNIIKSTTLAKQNLSKSPIEFLAEQGNWTVIKKIAEKLPVPLTEKTRKKRYHGFGFGYGDVYAYGYALTLALHAAANTSEKNEVYAEILNCARALIKAGVTYSGFTYTNKYSLEYAIEIQDEKIIFDLLKIEHSTYALASSLLSTCKMGNAKILSYILMSDLYIKISNKQMLEKDKADYYFLTQNENAKNQYPEIFKKAEELKANFKHLANIILLIGLGTTQQYTLCKIPVDVWPQIFRNLLSNILEESPNIQLNELRDADFRNLLAKTNEKIKEHDNQCVKNFLDDYDNPMLSFDFFRKYQPSEINLVENIRSNNDDMPVVKSLVQTFFCEKLDSDNYQETDIIKLMKKNKLADNQLIHDCSAKLNRK